MTPRRMIELECPECKSIHWEMDCDYRGIDGPFVEYSERPYACAKCKRVGTGYTTLRMSPPEFFLQPHRLYPMKTEDIVYWQNICEANFPKEEARRAERDREKTRHINT